MAYVVKWLTLWFVAPTLAGSIPVARPMKKLESSFLGFFYFFTRIWSKKMCYTCYKWINLLCINGFHVASTFFYMLHFFVKFAKSSTSQRISCSTKRATFLLHFSKNPEKQKVIAHFLYYHSVLHS